VGPNFILSSSCDGYARLWYKDALKGFNIKPRLFKGHGKDLTAVDITSDFRLIATCSLDRTIRLWNILGEEKHVIQNAHNSWVNSVKFFKLRNEWFLVSVGLDEQMKIWTCSNPNTPFMIKNLGPGNYNVVCPSPDSSLIAVGTSHNNTGKLFVYVVEGEDSITTLNCDSPVNAIAFNPN